MKLTGNKIFSFMLAAAFALTLAGCGGGGAAMMPDGDGTMPGPDKNPQELCEEAGGRWNADMTCTTAEMLEAEAAADKKADATKSANTKTKAIADEGMQTDDAGLGGATATNPVAIAHKDGAVSISVSRGDGDEKVDFVKMADLTGADDSTGSMNELGPNDDGETEIAIVYTDIQAPTDIPFIMADGKGRHTLDINPKTENGTDHRSLEIDQGNAGMAAADLLSTPTGAGTVTLVGLDEEDTEDVKENEFRGTFDGAMGTFTCTGGAGGCAATIADGKLSTVSNLYFTPDKDETVSEPDGDYLHYGVWLMKTAQDDGSDEYNEVQTFAGSSLTVVENVSSIEGTASYKGGAAGVYVRDVYNPDRTQESATSGHFTADVNLMAYFSGDDVAENKKNSIEGTIDGFSLSGKEDASGWGAKVEASIDGSAVATGTAKGGGAGNGSFTANFHGADTKDVDGTATPIGPKVMVGEFNAEFTNGSVAGGFGARRK